MWFPAAVLRNWSAGKSSSCVVINSFSHYGWWLCSNYVEISTEDCCGWGLNYLFLCSTRPAVGRGSLCYLSELRGGLQAGVGIWCHTVPRAAAFCASPFARLRGRCKANRDLRYLFFWLYSVPRCRFGVVGLVLYMCLF